MGYSTDFSGKFLFDLSLNKDLAAYIRSFNETRRMKRDPTKAKLMLDARRDAVLLPIGPEACYFTGGLGHMGQEDDDSVLDNNHPPAGQPGLWCGWITTPNGNGIEWDGGEKFYDYTYWLKYLIKHFFEPWDRKLSGRVKWQGEDSSDKGVIIVKDNKVEVQGR